MQKGRHSDLSEGEREVMTAILYIRGKLLPPYGRQNDGLMAVVLLLGL